MKNYNYFLILCFLTFLSTEASKYVLNINGLLYDSLANQLTVEQLNKAFASIRKWQLWGYLLIPILILLKTHIIALVLSVGTFFFNIKIAYKKLWNIVLKAEFIFLFVSLIKLGWFYFFKTDFTLEELQLFYPLSTLSFIGAEGVEPWYIYPLQVSNVFEVVYWIVLAFLIDKALNIKKGNLGIKIVASSYGLALLIWVVAVMFFTLNMS